MNKHLVTLGFCMMALVSLTSCNNTCCETNSMKTQASYDYLYEGLPFKMERVKQPVIPDYTVSITDFGAVGDGKTLNTDAFQKAIKHVAEKGGGHVVIPEGLWYTGPIRLYSKIDLHTEKNALVVFTTDHTQYPFIDTYYEGTASRRCQSPIYAVDAEDVSITGEGVFDGSGDSWRPVKKEKMTERQWSILTRTGVVDAAGRIWNPSDFEITQYRPVMVSIVKCKRVLLEGTTFKNSPSWCLHPLMCDNVTIHNVKVFNPWYSQNGDALDLESCSNALIVDNLFDAGDDAICIKSGKNKEGRDRGMPTQNVIVSKNTVLHGHGGFVVGSEMSGGVKNIYVNDCTFLGTDVGLRFKSTRGRGGVVEGIYINNINMLNIPNEALLFDLFYGGMSPNEARDAGQGPKKEAVIPPVTEETPVFRDIHISNVRVMGAGRAALFNGLPEMPIENVTIKNMTITDAGEDIVSHNTKNVVMEHVTVILK